MRPWISRHLGSLVLGGLVLVVLMTTSATAALVITGKDIKNGSVTTKDVKNDSLKATDLAKSLRSQLGVVGTPCTVPGDGPGTVKMTVAPDAVITFVCARPPVSGADIDGDTDAFQRSQECNDNAASMNPTVTEVFANRVDDNCDGVTDDGLSSGDQDGDGYAPSSLDCDDTVSGATIHPGAADTLGDGRDNNCDGVDGQA